MGEVIEASIISSNRTLYKELLLFIRDFTKIKSVNCEIHRLDDWRYSNECSLDALSEIDQWVDSKIITIAEKNDIGSIGVNIEKEGDKFIYDVWHNPKNEIDAAKYSEFKEKTISMLKSMQFEMACIGREISVDYSKGYGYVAEKARGIDCIIALESIEEIYHISEKISLRKKKPEYYVI